MTTLKEYLKKLNSLESIHVIGTSGTEGSEIALFLNKYGIKNVILHDFANNLNTYRQNFFKSHSGIPTSASEQKWQELKKLKYTLNLNKNYLKEVESANLIFVPQSWYLYPQNKTLTKLKDKIEFSSMTQLYLTFAPCLTIGVTGSNGKSTTTALIYHLLKQQTNKNTYIAGNDRSTPQILQMLDRLAPTDIIVAEISNRQLVDISNASPKIAVITNVTQNHLAEHADFAEYKFLKSKIFLYQKPSDHLFLNESDPESLTFEQTAKSNLHWYKETFDYPEFKLKGTHNLQNLGAAVQVAKHLGLTEDQIKNGIKTFTGLPGRMEIVHTKDDLVYINDRQGTAVDATIKALQSLTGNITLIFGGQNKGMPVQELCKTITDMQVLPIGIESPFVNECKPHLNNLVIAPNLIEAINYAKQRSPKPGTILFSPACEYGPFFTGKAEHTASENFAQLAK